MKYFRLKESFGKTEPFLYGELITYEEEEDCIYDGIPFEEEKNLSFFKNNKKHKDFFTSGSFAIISPQFRKLLEPYTEQIPYYPVSLSERGAPFNEEPFFLPLFPLKSCFDYEKSDYRGVKEDEYISSIQKMVVDEKGIGGSHIFRFKEIPALIIVSEFLKKEIEKAGIVGVEFVAMEDFKYPLIPYKTV